MLLLMDMRGRIMGCTMALRLLERAQITVARMDWVGPIAPAGGVMPGSTSGRRFESAKRTQFCQNGGKLRRMGDPQR